MTYRREVVGFVWQQTAKNLLPYLSAVENVEMPMILNGAADRERAMQLLRTVGLVERADHRPDRFDAERRPAGGGERVVDGRGQVAAGVEQGAIEVEPDDVERKVDHRRPPDSIGLAMARHPWHPAPRNQE